MLHYNGAGLPSDNVVQLPAGETGLGGTYTTRYSYTTTGLPSSVAPVTKGDLPGEHIVVEYDRYGQPKSTFGYNSIVSASTYTPHGEPAQYPARRFDGLPHELVDGVPVLREAAASVVCRLAGTVPALDHTLLFGTVTDVRSTEKDPLVLLDDAAVLPVPERLPAPVAA